MDQEIKEGRGCGPNKDYILLKLDHLGAETIHKRLPSVYEIGVNFANVDITKEPIPWFPPSTTRWVACPPTSTARSWSKEQCEQLRGERPCTLWANALRERARRQPPGHQLAAGPAGVRQAASRHIVEFNNKNKEHKPLPPTRRPHAGTPEPAGRKLQRAAPTPKPWLATSAPRCSNTPACSAPRPAWTRRQKIAELRDRVASVTCKTSPRCSTPPASGLEVDNLIEVAQATMVSAAARKGMPWRPHRVRLRASCRPPRVPAGP